MGNCSTKNIKCFYCNNLQNENIYMITITHKSEFNNRNICSICFEQKVLEKQKIKNCTDILPSPHKIYN